MIGAQPWYITALQYAIPIVQILFQIFLLIILFFALREFKKFVSAYRGEPLTVEEMVEEEIEEEM